MACVKESVEQGTETSETVSAEAAGQVEKIRQGPGGGSEQNTPSQGKFFRPAGAMIQADTGL